jgi:ankyrin repeat protein
MQVAMTALHLAAESNNPSVVSVLLKYGANIEARALVMYLFLSFHLVYVCIFFTSFGVTR